MKTVTLPNGDVLPKLGLGTWGMGEGGDLEAEAAALVHGLTGGSACSTRRKCMAAAARRR